MNTAPEAVRDEAIPPATDSRDRFFGHPRGLAVIGGTEFWDRISFHGMQALLVLYMVDRLLLPGHVEHVAGFATFRAVLESITGPLSVRALASQIFGLYVGFVYLMPIAGGALGDRVLGRRRAVLLGALTMTAGHFCMAFEWSFLLALLLLVTGAGLLRGNLVSQLGDLYAKDDHRRDTAFQIYYSVLNCGAFVAPLVTGSLASSYGWDYGFGFAGFGMLGGCVLYGAGLRHLPRDLPRRAAAAARLDAAARRVITCLVLMLPLVATFWVAQTQIWNTYNLWARDHLDLVVAGWNVPIPWLQSVDALAAIVLVPPILRFWHWQDARGREPDDLAKMGIGCVLFAIALLWLAMAQLVVRAGHPVPLWWALTYHALSGPGYIYFAPIAVALYSRVAPATVNAMMIGIYLLGIFAGSLISGRLGGLYERLSAAEFWLLHAAIIGGGGVLLLLLAPRLRRELGLPAAATTSRQTPVPA